MARSVHARTPAGQSIAPFSTRFLCVIEQGKGKRGGDKSEKKARGLL